MSELLKNNGQESKTRKFLKWGLLGFTVVSLPIATLAAIKAFAAGEVFAGTVAGTFAAGDAVQIAESRKPDNEKSRFNPERYWNGFFDKLGIGTSKANTRSALAAGISR